MSRMNRLMAVPPLSAKSGSAATNGSVRVRSVTWLWYRAGNAIQVPRHRDVIARIEDAAFDEHALANTDQGLVDLRQPNRTRNRDPFRILWDNSISVPTAIRP